MPTLRHPRHQRHPFTARPRHEVADEGGRGRPFFIGAPKLNDSAPGQRYPRRAYRHPLGHCLAPPSGPVTPTESAIYSPGGSVQLDTLKATRELVTVADGAGPKAPVFYRGPEAKRLRQRVHIYIRGAGGYEPGPRGQSWTVVDETWTGIRAGLTEAHRRRRYRPRHPDSYRGGPPDSGSSRGTDSPEHRALVAGNGDTPLVRALRARRPRRSRPRHRDGPASDTPQIAAHNVSYGV